MDQVGFCIRFTTEDRYFVLDALWIHPWKGRYPCTETYSHRIGHHPTSVKSTAEISGGGLWHRKFFAVPLFMVPLCNRADHYIFALLFLSSSSSSLFIPHLISAVAGWMSTILWHMVWP